MKNIIDDKSDAESLEYFIENYLKPAGYQNIINNNDVDKFAPIDIEADKNGVHYNFELKRRRCNSYTYPNSVLSAEKFKILRERDGKCYYVALFYDKIALFDVKDDNQIDKFGYSSHKKTTDFDKNYMVTEYCPYFKINKTLNYR